VLGFLAGVQGRYERAAVLLGAAPTLWEQAGYHYTGVPLLEELHRRTAQAAIDSLGEARYAQLREAGAGQPLEEVIALALGSASQPGPELVPGTAAAPPSAASATSAVPPDAAPAALPGTGRRGAPAVSGAAFPATGPLTSREVEIAQLVANGLTNKEIARRMAVSKRTVDAHVDHIFAKLGISSRVQLTLWLRDRVPRARAIRDRGHRLT
jgi:DNA-binding CsgD family transcriptional regulator